MILLKKYKLYTINQQLKFGLMEHYQIILNLKGDVDRAALYRRSYLSSL